jgi:hypothetical protein
MRTNSKRRGLLGTGTALAGGLVLVLATMAALAGSGSAAGQTAAAPVNEKRPSITGTKRVGEVLTSTLGEWSSSLPVSYVAEWKRCDSAGSNCAIVASGTVTAKATYTLVSADAGRRMRVTIIASNNDGKTSATSDATSIIAAAPPMAPRNTSPPTISGTAQEEQLLMGNAGQWQGTPPIDLNFFWQRCNRNGGSCANISGATSTAYKLTSVDVGDRIRLRIQANNRAGRTNAYSAPTAVVAAKGPSLPPGAIRLADGKYSIPVTSVAPPERLVIGQLDFSPNPLRSRNALITARFRISDTRGYIVRSALVFVTPLPYGWVTQPDEVASDTEGWATVHMRANPQLPKRSAIVMFVRARKGGDFVLTGISNRRLVQMLVAIP